MNAPDGNRPASAPAERVVLGPAGEEERVLLATDHNIPAPTPAELAQLAVAMVTAGIASKHNPSEAMRIASDWWIAARRRSEQVELAEMYRRIALDIRVKRAEAGEMSEDAVMTMATHVPKSPTHFRGRAADFFALDWAQPNVHLSDISRRALQLFAAARDQMRIQALEPVPRSGIGRRWKHTIALAFVEYLKVHRSAQNSHGGKATAAKAAAATNAVDPAALGHVATPTTNARPVAATAPKKRRRPSEKR